MKTLPPQSGESPTNCPYSSEDWRMPAGRRVREVEQRTTTRVVQMNGFESCNEWFVVRNAEDPLTVGISRSHGPLPARRRMRS